MDRRQKKDFVDELHEAVRDAELVVVTRQSGMTVSEASDLRNKAREAGVTHKVVKNRLAKIALKETNFSHLEEHLTGPTSLSYSTDPVAAAKLVADYAKGNDKLSIVAGMLYGRVMDAEEIKKLASLPSLDELRSTIIGILQAPAGKIAQITSAPGAQLARVINAYSTKS